MRRYIFPLITIMAGCACNGPKDMPANTPAPSDDTDAAATARVVVYRTKTDHRSHVPVQLSPADGTIISYPHPRDLRSGNGSALPTELGNGYLLDNRGIGLNVAFLDIDHATYAAMDQAPPLKELEAHIVDHDPLMEYYDCGSRHEYTDLLTDLMSLVKSGELGSKCKRMK